MSMSEITKDKSELRQQPESESQESLALRMQVEEKRIFNSIQKKITQHFHLNQDEEFVALLQDEGQTALDILDNIETFGLSLKESTTLYGLLAATYAPDQAYEGGIVKKSDPISFDKHAEESHIARKIWRTSVNKLVGIGTWPPRKGRTYSGESYKFRRENADLANVILSMLQKGATPGLLIPEAFTATGSFEPLEMPLGFELFPAGESDKLEEELEHLKELLISEIEQKLVAREINKERLRFFVENYVDNKKKGNDVMVWYSKVKLSALLGGENDEDNSSMAKFNHYFVMVIIPRVEQPESKNINDDQGEVLVIAYADNFTEGNAMFVHRSDIDIAGTWQETFALSKRDAKDFCTKIVHTGAWQDRALSVLA